MKYFVLMLSLSFTYVKAQSQSLNVETVDSYVYVDNDFFNINSNEPLESCDIDLVQSLDSYLFEQDLFIENCFVFRLNDRPVSRNMITVQLTNGIDKVFIIKRQSTLSILNEYTIDPITNNFNNK